MRCLSCKYLFVYFCFASSIFAIEREKLSQLEQSAVTDALRKHELFRDPSPQDKKIGKFYFYTEKAIDPKERLVGWVSKIQFHTKDSAIKSQLWMKPGDLYNSNIIIQNEQTLLNPTVRSFILILPVQPKLSPSKDTVDLLIVSKDVLSWRASYKIAGSSDGLSSFSINLSQTNLLGLNKTVGLSFGLEPQLVEWGAFYQDPSLFSTKNQLSAMQGVFLNRAGWGFEGVEGSFQISYPVIVETVKWGYSALFNYNYKPFFDYQGVGIRRFDGLERKYHQFQLNPSFVLIRSFGKVHKSNISFGYGLSYAEYKPLEKVSENFIKNVLPVNELQSFAIVGYNYFQNKFLALYNYDTFSVTEWQRLGPRFSATNHFAWTGIGSDRTFFRPLASFTASVPVTKTGLFIFSLSGQTRLQLDRSIINNTLGAELTLVAPTIGQFGRFVTEAKFSSIWDNQNNTQLVLGANSGLRGVPFQFYAGNNLVRANLEFRTTSVQLWLIRLGLVAFYDFGAAFSSESQFKPTQDAGIGIRIMVIPWNRIPFRIDVATPFDGPRRGFNNTQITFGFGPAF
ncbi:MAG: hypothetical protein JKY15_02565 [Deltaproteobacteria bacterium]|nr:hypothetical protein [Deltaproteobacteria bacterium]